MMFRGVVAAFILAVSCIWLTGGAIAETRFNFTTQKSKVPERYNKRKVRYTSNEKPGTIVVDTRRKYLYYVLGNDQAVRYGIGVGREGFRWKGTERISRKAKWPDWRPPAEMIQRQPELPEFVPGGPNNPLGARALYLGGTLYRIHGTKERWSIGRSMSSGCIRMLNEDVIDLFERARVGTKVIVR